MWIPQDLASQDDLMGQVILSLAPLAAQAEALIKAEQEQLKERDDQRSWMVERSLGELHFEEQVLL